MGVLREDKKFEERVGVEVICSGDSRGGNG